MFLPDGSETETIDVMHRIWTGAWPENRAPQIKGMTLDGKTSDSDISLAPGATVAASVESSDPNGDGLKFEWVLLEESQATQTGGDLEDVPDEVSGQITGGDGSEISLTTPTQPGAYRLFVYVRDGKAKAGHANIPFQVR